VLHLQLKTSIHLPRSMPVKVGMYVNGEFRKSRSVSEGEELSVELPEGERAGEDIEITYKIEEIIPN